jgi:hypothetical protein
MNSPMISPKTSPKTSRKISPTSSAEPRRTGLLPDGAKTAANPLPIAAQSAAIGCPSAAFALPSRGPAGCRKLPKAAVTAAGLLG